jgi:protein-disulfide isomerase
MPGALSHFCSVRLICGTAVLAACALAAHAQSGNSLQGTRVLDASPLKPPAGARVAMIEFEDMECPVCASDNLTLKQAAATYKIPWVRHDFPLHQHVWSFQAAVNARWFDTRSKKLGDDYRDAIFANQSAIYNLNVLSTFTQRFAQGHGVALPFAIDPQGKLAADVKADYALGARIGVRQTPTVWIVAARSKGAPYVEISANMSGLYQTIDQALADTKDAAAPSARKRSTTR